LVSYDSVAGTANAVQSFVAGTPGLSLAACTDFKGSDGIPQFNGAKIIATVPAGGTATNNCTRWLLSVPAAGDSAQGTTAGNLIDVVNNVLYSPEWQYAISLGRPAPQYPEHCISQYDGGIAYEDAQIGRVVAWLKSHNAYDNTMIVVTSDHGEGQSAEDLGNLDAHPAWVFAGAGPLGGAGLEVVVAMDEVRGRLHQDGAKPTVATATQGAVGAIDLVTLIARGKQSGASFNRSVRSVVFNWSHLAREFCHLRFIFHNQNAHWQRCPTRRRPAWPSRTAASRA
jgi:hypothetical protein